MSLSDARAESVLRALGKAHEAQFNSARNLGPDATAGQLNAARKQNYASATRAFQDEHRKTMQAYKQSAKTALARFNASISGLLRGGAAAGDKLPGQVLPQQAAPRNNAPQRPVTLVTGPKGASKVKFGSERNEAVVIDGIVQDAPSAPAAGDPNVVDGIVQGTGDAAPGRPPGKATSGHPATDDSGIVQDR